MADFYLASSEGYGLEQPRACHALKRVRTAKRDDYLLARVEPPIPGKAYGLGGFDISTVLIATRHVGSSLFPIGEWPVFVHVARPLIADPDVRDSIADSELEEIGWAELYPSHQEAEAKALNEEAR